MTIRFHMKWGRVCFSFGWSRQIHCSSPCTELYCTIYSATTAWNALKLHTDIGWGSPQCRKRYDLNWPWTWEMARNLNVENHIFALFFFYRVPIQNRHEDCYGWNTPYTWSWLWLYENGQNGRKLKCKIVCLIGQLPPDWPIHYEP